MGVSNCEGKMENPILPSNQTGAGYIPYFYASGQFMRYNTPEQIRDNQQYLVTDNSSYQFSINPDKPQTVEQVLYQGYFAVPKSSEPAAAMITDKTHTSWMGLDDVIGQIKGRNEIYETNMYELELAKCSAFNVFFEHVRNNGNIASDRVYYSLNKNISRIYEQQMNERVKLWQDISKLRRDLPEAAQSYLSSMRKSDIFKDDSGDNI